MAPIMERILIHVNNRRDRRSLQEWLSKDYEIIDGDSPDALWSEFELGIVDGPALKEWRTGVLARRAREEPMLLPFLLLTFRRRGRKPTRPLGQLVDDLLVRPIYRDELKARVANLLRLRRFSLQLKREHDRVVKLSVTDDVSGFHNTRYLHRYLDRVLAAPSGPGRLSLVFFDLDNFKQVVDAHGHLLGSKVLREVAQAVHRELAPDDRLVRYGGDEFVVILPRQDKSQALAKVQRIKHAVSATDYLQKENLRVRITASFGLATFPEDAHSKKELLAEADRCLFRSKSDGKNRISLIPVTPLEKHRDEEHETLVLAG
jgi:diguanylate cyclase (GGDEF)-like protein